MTPFFLKNIFTGIERDMCTYAADGMYRLCSFDGEHGDLGYGVNVAEGYQVSYYILSESLGYIYTYAY